MLARCWHLLHILERIFKTFMLRWTKHHFTEKTKLEEGKWWVSKKINNVSFDLALLEKIWFIYALAACCWRDVAVTGLARCHSCSALQNSALCNPALTAACSISSETCFRTSNMQQTLTLGIIQSFLLGVCVLATHLVQAVISPEQ